MPGRPRKNLDNLKREEATIFVTKRRNTFTIRGVAWRWANNVVGWFKTRKDAQQFIDSGGEEE